MKTRIVVPFETFLFGSLVSFLFFSKNFVLEKNYLAYLKAFKFQNQTKTKHKPKQNRQISPKPKQKLTRLPLSWEQREGS